MVGAQGDSASLLAHGGRVGLREVATLAWPVVVQMLSVNAMLLADALFVGRVSTPALAGVGLAGTALMLVHSFGNGLLGGVRVETSHATGAREHGRAEAALAQGIWLALGYGLPLLAIIPLTGVLVPLLGAGEGLSAHAANYMAWMLLSAPVLCLEQVIAGWLQGRGDTRTPMAASIGGNALNVALDAVLVLGFGPVAGHGVVGAAVATVLSRVAITSFLLLRVRAVLQRSAEWPRRAPLARISAFGTPMGVRWTLDVTSWLAFATIVSWVGEAHLAAHVIGVRLIVLTFLPGYAIGEAAGVLVGQSLGAQRPDLALNAWASATWLALGLMLGLGSAFWIAPGWLLAPFHPTPEVEAIGRQLLFIAGAFQVVDAVATVGLGSLNGAGDTRFVMALSFLAAWFVKMPLVIALAWGLGWGAPGAWIGLTGEITVVALVSVWRVRTDRLRPRVAVAMAHQ